MLILASVGNLVAQELPPPAPASNAQPLPGTSASTDNSQGTDNTQTPTNPQVPNTPLLPQQGANPYLPFSTTSATTSTSSQVQSPQLTAPGLYTTGVNNVSQIATNASLTQAFSQEPVSGFLSEQAFGYSYPPIERIRLGPFDLKAAVSTNVVYDDNLEAGEQNQGRISGASFGVTPAILLEYGAQEGQRGYASVTYAPTITRFFDHSDLNTTNQNVALNLRYPFQRLSLDLSQTYSQVTGINQNLNARTTQTSSVTTVGGSYEIDDKLSLSSHFQELITNYSGTTGNSSGQGEGDTTSSINTSLLYHLSAKMTLGPSVNVGIDKPQNAKQATYEQALLGLSYQPTEKISLFAQAGAEFRQGNENGQSGPNAPSGDTTNPIFSAGVGYTPFDSTTLSVSASQSVYASSANSTQTVVNTGVGFSATQRFFQRFYLNFSFSYSHNDYQNGNGGMTTTTGSSQDTLSYRPSLTFAPNAWSSVALYYQYLNNTSNSPGGSYYDNQMGVSVSAQF
ncbi:MAG: outer membrane beta-barrel protein [Methylacidiphilales bacterium]|nr:outer membrane beta-barrel protein [Candidatus Methylacidiphilales bacterium]